MAGLLLPLLLTVAAEAADRLADGGQDLGLPVACPVHSWCLPSGLCDPGYVLFNAKQPTGEAPLEQFVCGVTENTHGYVCCDTQELLPHHFKPTPFHWFFQGKGEEITGGLVVAPWPTFSIEDLEELEQYQDDDDIGNEHYIQNEHKHKNGEHDANHEGEYRPKPDESREPYHRPVEDKHENEWMHVKLELLEELARLRESENRLRQLEEQIGAEGHDGRAVKGRGNADVAMGKHDSERHQKTPGDGHGQQKGQESRQVNLVSPAVGDAGRQGELPGKPTDPGEPDAPGEAYDTTGSAERAPPLRICPPHSLCVPWHLCQDQNIAYDSESSRQKCCLCGLTEDSEGFVCCGRLSLAPDLSAPAAVPAQAGEAAQLPLDHLAEMEMFSEFSPPPHVAMPRPPSSAGEHDHYLSDVLLKARQRRDLPASGQVIYPSEIAARRLQEGRGSPAAAGGRPGAAGEAGHGTAFRSTLAGRLKPAGTVKLGGLAPPLRRISGGPDLSRELPVRPPLPAPAPQSHQFPQSRLEPPSQQELVYSEEDSSVDADALASFDESLGDEFFSVTPRTVEPLENVDIRPLRAKMWRGDAPEIPPSRAAADDSGAAADSDLDPADTDIDSGRADGTDSGRRGSVLTRILDSLSDGLASKSRQGHQHEQNSVRGHFFGGPPPLPVHRPTQPPRRRPRPPFQPPAPPQLRPDPPSPAQAGHHGPPEHLHQPHQRPGQQQSGYEQPHQSSTSLHSAPCGRGAGPGLHARITTKHGEDGTAGYGEFPWHVGVLTVDLTYRCAGALVAPRLALTVAHCVTPLPPGAPLLVRLGDWDLAAEDELYPAYDVEVVRTVVHPDFYAGNLQNDIALLVLDPPVEGLPHVQPACLPPPQAQFAHQHCWVPGWGQARHVSGELHDPRSYSWRLRKAALAVVPPGSCQHHLRTTQLGPFYRLPPRGALCAAGQHGSDACFGDGGGALVCPLREDGPGGPLYAAGLVSWGIGCGQDIPAVYTKVSDYHDWIASVLSDIQGSAYFQYSLGPARGSAREGKQQ